MTTAAWGLLGVAGVLAVVDWVAVGRGDRRLERLAKPATTVLLLVVALVVEPIDPAQRTLFAVALVASLAGDVALMFDRFLPGLGSFLVAHLAYIAGFLVRDISVTAAAVGGLAVLAVAVPVAVRMIGALREGPRRSLTTPVAAYVVVISVMVTAAAGTALPVAIVGAVLFYVSDALIGWHRFVEPRPWAPVAIMVTYHLGQALLVISLTT